MEEEPERIPRIRVGKTYKKLSGYLDFDHVMRGVPVYSPEELKTRLEEGKDRPLRIGAKILWGTVGTVMDRVRDDCREAKVDLTQEDVDKIYYFSSRLFEALAGAPHSLILAAELAKRYYNIDLSDTDDPKEMFKRIDEAVEEKGSAKNN